MLFNLRVLKSMQYAAKVAKSTEDWHIQGKQEKPAQTHLLWSQIRHYSKGTIAISSGITLLRRNVCASLTCYHYSSKSNYKRKH